MNSETAKRIAQLLKRRENAKHVIKGEVIYGKIKVWERCKDGDPLLVEATDGSIVWLVERLVGKYAGRADLWRACDIRRLKRGLQPKLNKCETAYSTDDVGLKVEQGMAYWNERLERAEERLAELKRVCPRN